MISRQPEIFYMSYYPPPKRNNCKGAEKSETSFQNTFSGCLCVAVNTFLIVVIIAAVSARLVKNVNNHR